MEEPNLKYMERNYNSEEIEYYHSNDSNSTTSFAVWAPKNGNNLPVVLFQSGYGSDSVSHTPLLKKIAEAGFIVIAPDEKNDKWCGSLSVFGFLVGLSCSAMSTDGSHLEKALNYAKNKENKFMDRADHNKIALIGFSMGGQEVIHANARFSNEVSAIVLLSGSVMLPLATYLGWNPFLYPCSGGSCTLCSDTPVGMCSMGKSLRSWNVPNLIITSERDMARDGAYRAANIAGGDSMLITFKDSSLDLDIPHTKKTSIWKYFSYLTCYGSPFYGLRQHFALGSEEKDVSHLPINAFLKSIFYDGPNLKNNNFDFKDNFVDSKLNSRTKKILCSPFPLFISCCEC